MAYPKSMYKVSPLGDMREIFAASLEDACALTKKGWCPHPEEARIANECCGDFSKAEIDNYAKTLGFELDRRKSKENMLRDLKKMMK